MILKLTDPILLDSVLDELHRIAPIENRETFDSERVKTLIAKGETVYLMWSVQQLKTSVYWITADKMRTDAMWLAERERVRRKGMKGLF